MAAPTAAGPHARQARSAQGAWGAVALLLLPGIVLGILNVAVLLWRNLAHTKRSSWADFWWD